MYLTTHFSTFLDVYFFQSVRLKKREPSCYEFVFIQSGAITVSNENGQYILSQGDIFLFRPGNQYETTPLSQNFCLAVHFGTNFIDSLIPHNGILICNSAAGKKNDYRNLCQVLTDITREFPLEDNNYKLQSLVCRFADILKKEHIQIRPDTKETAADDRIRTIQTFIRQNYHLPISLQEMADRLYLSSQYLSRFIREHMGVTFIHYLNQIRLTNACDELANTDHTITEVAFNNGFSNTASFNKNFRSTFGVSPSTFRTAEKKKLLSDISKSEYSSEKEEIALQKEWYLRFLEQSSKAEKIQKISIDGSHSLPIYPSWSDTINIGALSNALSISFHRLFKDFQHNTGFHYVRFDSVFSEEIMRPLTSGNGYDYTNLNMIFDFFQELNIVPFIELSYKPQKRNLTTFLRSRAEESFKEEQNPAYYRHAFTDFLRHCINRYGYANVSKWRFELWAKHDELLNYIESPGEYADRFAAFRRILKEFLPDCPMGGPGFNTSASLSVFRNILRELELRKLRPDFISIYIYCYGTGRYNSPEDNGHIHLLLSENADIFKDMFFLYKKETEKITGSRIPLYITEYNSGLTGNNYVSGSAFQAAFICRNILQIFQETPCIAYWHFSDVLLNAGESSEQYSTDNGLINIHGIPKASLFAYIFLTRLKTRLIAQEENYIVTTSGNNRFQLLAYNYAHYNQEYCINYRLPVSIEHTYDVFEDTGTRSLQIHLHNLPEGWYKIARHTLNRRHGSILDTFIQSFTDGYVTSAELNYMLLNMQPYEVEYYKHTVRPLQEIWYKNTDETNGFTLSFSMEPHEVVLFELARKAQN